MEKEGCGGWCYTTPVARSPSSSSCLPNSRLSGEGPRQRRAARANAKLVRSNDEMDSSCNLIGINVSKPLLVWNQRRSPSCRTTLSLRWTFHSCRSDCGIGIAGQGDAAAATGAEQVPRVVRTAQACDGGDGGARLGALGLSGH